MRIGNNISKMNNYPMGNQKAAKQNDGTSQKLMNPGESFQKTKIISEKSFYNLNDIAKKMLRTELGKEMWSFKTDTAALLNVLITPTGRLICQDQGKIYSLDKDTGKKKWDVPKDKGGVSSLTSLRDGTVFSDAIVSGSLVAVDGDTGEEKWRYKDHNLGNIGMTQSKQDDSLFIGGLEDNMKKKKIIGLDGKTGKVKWEKSFDSNTASGLRLSGDGSTLVTDLTGSILALDSKTGNVKWQFDTANLQTMSMAAPGYNGDVYFGGRDGQIHAIDGKSGKEKWTFKTGEKDPGSPLVGDDGTLFWMEKGSVTAIDGESGKEKWQYKSDNDIINSLGITKEGNLLAYNLTSGRLMEIDSKSGKPKRMDRLERLWMNACIDQDGFLYYSGDDNKIHAKKISISQKEVEKVLEESRKQTTDNKTATIEQKDGFVIIGDVKLPINSGR